MRAWVVVVLAAVVGTATGAYMAHWRVTSLPWDGTPEGAKIHLSTDEAAKLNVSSVPDDGVPEVVVDHTEYNFGLMDSSATGRHEFTFTNKGTGTLKLSKGHTTCKCTMANFEHAEVPPGQSTKVTLEFKGQGFSGPYKQTATVITNDPKQPQVELMVAGRIIPILRAVPSEVSFTGISAGAPVTRTVDLFGYVDTPLQITGFELADKKTAEMFEIKTEPIKPEVLAKEAGAKSGVQLSVTVKPGLPVGAFKQTIHLSTNLEGAPHHDLEVSGNVVSDLVIVGARWDEERSLLGIGTVSSKEEVSRRLILIARGKYRDQVKLKIAEVWPDLLKVEFEPPVAVGETIRQFPIVIRIPKGTPPANYLGSEAAQTGRIVLETNHPDAPKMLIRVGFAVEN